MYWNEIQKIFFGAYVLPLFCFFCAYLLWFCLFLHVWSFLLFFFLLLFSNLGLDWVLRFFFRGFETSHWITVKKDFDKV